MQTLKTDNGHTVRYYSSLDEFPAERRSYLLRYTIEAAEIALSPDDLTDAIARAIQAINEDRKKDAVVYLQNIYVSCQAVKETYTPDAYRFGCLIKDIDGVPVDDLSPEGLNQVVSKLGMTVGEMGYIADNVKKNSISSVTAISLGLLSVR